jgi:hypothetical protein
MKKLMTLMLGLSLVLGSVAVVFAQDTATKKEDTAKKKAKKKKAETPKKDTGR